MIKTWYVADLKGGELRYCSSCGKPSTEDPKMIRILLQCGLNIGTVVNLCDECRRELYEKI